MPEATNVIIGIQARTGSNRLPGKVLLPFGPGKKKVLDRVIDACNGAAHYLNSQARYRNALVKTALLIPFDDKEIQFLYKDRIPVYEGSETDVLSRYMSLAHQVPSNYIVRITSDCPMIPQWLISKIIGIALINKYDYCSNVDERCRTTPDGWDVEVFSFEMLRFAFENAKDPYDREHVTPFMRKSLPSWSRQGFVINSLDLSALKISIDSEEDLAKAREEESKVQKKMEIAQKLYGKSSVHRV